jgi:hypothetical protein
MHTAVTDQRLGDLSGLVLRTTNEKKGVEETDAEEAKGRGEILTSGGHEGNLYEFSTVRCGERLDWLVQQRAYHRFAEASLLSSKLHEMLLTGLRFEHRWSR